MQNDNVLPFDFNGQRTDYLADIGLNDRRLKTGGPRKEPPAPVRLDVNPRAHDVVAWRRDGLRLDTSRHANREAAEKHAAGLPWIIYYQFAIMDGRTMLDIQPIGIPDGMAIDNDGLPVKL